MPLTRRPRGRLLAVVLLLAVLLLCAAGVTWYLSRSRDRGLRIVYGGQMHGAMLRTSLTAKSNVVDAFRHIEIPQMHTLGDEAALLERLRADAARDGQPLLFIETGNTLVGGDLLNRCLGGAPAAQALAQMKCDLLAPQDLEWTLGPQRLQALPGGVRMVCSNVTAAGILPRVEGTWGSRRATLYAWYEPPASPRLPALRRQFRGLDFQTDRTALRRQIDGDGAALHVVVAAVDDVDTFARDLPPATIVLPAREGRVDLSHGHDVNGVFVAPLVDGRRALGTIVVPPVGPPQAALVSYPQRAEGAPAEKPERDPLAGLIDPGVAQLRDKLGPDFLTIWERFVAWSPTLMPHEVELLTPSAAAQWVCDAMRERMGADVALLNHKALRERLRHFVQMEAQVLYLDPFGNTVLVLEMSGTTLDSLLRRNAEENRRYLQVSGARVSYQPHHPESIQILIDGAPLDPKRTYRVATNDYLAEGAHGQEPLFSGARVVSRNNVCLNHLLWDRYNDFGWIPGPVTWTTNDGRPLRPKDATAGALAASGFFREAWARWQSQLAAKGTDSEQTRTEAAAFLLEAGLPELALDTLGAVSRAPGLQTRGRIEVVLMQWPQATQDLAQAARLDPRDMASRALLGWVAFGQGDAKQARQAWTEAAALTRYIDAATLRSISMMLPKT